MPMENPARLFNCASCQQQVIICSGCDRGNIYCTLRCSRSARKRSLCAANQRYQASFRGRQKHAERQRRYRQRQKEKIEKVTYQGSPDLPPHDSLPPEPKSPPEHSIQLVTDVLHCDFCGEHVSSFLRIGFLHRDSFHTVQITSAWPRGP
jgi:hypothetical protein